ncbi:GNAT family N-acetyltransferase [Nocardioides coralli]|uniref:GNAT family N-acetyltransferase n=1 Tax=Nocardioides coralli TaxID=2872154 RepID=UPI001CA45379|nr:GNAT family protein [Nocardioides coralli]QZY29960.1 GNAT family N-acetyltransferase [Nocardioides coralli]
MTLRLTTDRLVLRPVLAGDLDVLLAIRNAPAVVPTTGTGEALPRERMAERLARRLASWRDHGVGSWLVLHEGEPVALVEVAPIGEGSGVDPDVLEIGVVVHPDHWGSGFAVEAGLAAARDLFGRGGHERVVIGVDPDNTRSMGALAKVPGVRRLDADLYELTAAALADHPA